MTFFPRVAFFRPFALNPFTSASSTMDGGLTFFSQPPDRTAGEDSDSGAEVESGMGRSSAGAEMTAEEETVPAAPTVNVVVVNAPIGIVAGFAF